MAAMLCAVAVTTACGQKPGVSDQSQPPLPVTFALPPGASVDPETGNIVDSSGTVIGNVGDADPSSFTGDTSGTSVSSSNDGTGPDGGDDNAPPSTGAPVAGDTTGVTKSTITIGAHAPLTGAAPVPSDSAHKGNSLWWEWLKETDRTINGRSVDAVLKNDNYNPSQAVAVCKEMVERDKVFLLYGFAGTDQIQACARYAASVGVPYLSVGVTEYGLDTLANYFAVSLSYAEQAPLLVDMMKTKLGAAREKNGMLRFDTPNFEDAHDAFVANMRDAKMSVVYDRAVGKNAGSAEAQTVVQEMKATGVQNVYVLTSPVWFLQVLQAARTQDYSPQWIGVGITKALDSVASVGCRSGTINGAKFFSPYPAWADIDRFDADFKKAIRTVYPEKEEGDDIMLIPWGIAKILDELLSAPGRDLSRQSFVAAAQKQRDIRTGVYPAVTFSADDHFGGTQVHLNEAQCSGYKAGDNRWHTIQSFVSDF
jgi:ABC-type branched-subunit amino acid transport system substrate-binding protein